jgi:hypothetical protein
MEQKQDKAFVRDVMKKLALLEQTNEDLKRWAEEARDLPTMQEKIEAMATDIRDTQQVVARILKYIL